MRAFLLAPTVLLASAVPPPRTIDNFRGDLSRWQIEAQPGATVRARSGVLDIDTRDGLTLWYRKSISGPVAIDYDIMPVAAGGAHDAVSDVNAFWMASDPHVRGSSALAKRRDGAFSSYDDLQTYYVGIGGNRNTTTRFRRYVGRRGDRPLLPEHDRRDAAAMLVSNRWTHIRLIADGHRIAVERDGRPLFAYYDLAPYRTGHFGLRTTKSHLLVRNVRITALSQ